MNNGCNMENGLTANSTSAITTTDMIKRGSCHWQCLCRHKKAEITVKWTVWGKIIRPFIFCGRTLFLVLTHLPRSDPPHANWRLIHPAMSPQFIIINQRQTNYAARSLVTQAKAFFECDMPIIMRVTTLQIMWNSLMIPRHFPHSSRPSSVALGMLSVTHITPVLLLLSVVGVGMQQYMIRNHILNI